MKSIAHFLVAYGIEVGLAGFVLNTPAQFLLKKNPHKRISTPGILLE